MASTNFFVTKGTSASNLNGGGPRLGTNDGPVYSSVNVDSTALGEGYYLLGDESGGNWGGTQVEDWLCYDTAGTKIWAKVVELNYEANPKNIRVLGVTGELAEKACNVGGAWATFDFAASTMTTAFVNGAGDPPTCYVKYSATSYAESVVMDNSGTFNVPLTFEGYETTPGDGCPNGNLPHIDATGLDTGISATTKTWLRIGNLRITATVANKFGINFATNSNYFTFYNLRVKSNYWTIYTPLSAYGYLFNCYSESASAVGIAIATETRCVDCVSQSAGTFGFALGSRTQAIGCIADTPGSDGFSISDGHAAALLDGCVCYGSVAGSGVGFVDASDGKQVITNCIFVGNNRYGIESNEQASVFEDYNAFFGNGIAERLNILEAGVHDVTLTGNPFVNAAAHNFALNATAGAGAACRAKGFPGAMLDGINIGYRDIGALQHQDSGAGGSGTLIGGGLTR